MIMINPYLNFMGTTEEAMNFYKSVLGGEFTLVQRFKDVTGSDKMPANEQNKILHIALPVGQSTIMATDLLESLGQTISEGNNNHLCLHAESEAEVDKLFNGLSAGGQVTMPVNRTFWGAYFGMFRDKYGVQWMITYDAPKQ